MTVLRISDFGRGGLNSDVQETLLPPNTWTELQNIDIESGDITSEQGESPLYQTPPIAPRYIYSMEVSTGGTVMLISDGTSLYKHEGGAGNWENITGVGDLGGGIITFSNFQGNVIVNSSESVPYYVPDVMSAMQELPGWQTLWRAVRIVGFGDFLVALAFNDFSTAGYKYTVAWSDAAGAGQIPQNWDFASGTSLAGSRQLRDTDGGLITAEQLRDDLILYKNDSIYRMYFREDVNVFGIERVISDHGCDSLWGVTAIGNVHYFADRGDLRIFDGQSTASVAAIQVKEKLQSAVRIGERDNTHVVGWPEREEVWVGIQPAGSSLINEILKYNILHKSWSRKTTVFITGLVLGPSVGTDTSNDEEKEAVIYGMEIGAAYFLFRSDRSITTGDDQAYSCVATKTGLRLGEINQNMTVRRAYIEMEGATTIDLELAFQYRPGGPITWTAPKSFVNGTTNSLPFRVTGMPVGIRVSSSTTTNWRLGAITLDVIPAKGR